MRRTVLLHSAHRDRFDLPDRDIVPFDRPIDAERVSRITEAHLWAPPDGPLDGLPGMIGAMTPLRSLSIGPGRVLPGVVTGLRQGDLPDGLEDLSIHVGDRTLVWPDVRVPNLRALYVDAPFRFDPEHFPRLRSLSITPLRSFSNVLRALALPLEELNLLTVPSGAAVFGFLEPTRIRRLGLLGGRSLRSLAGIEALPELESLRLKNLSALGDVSDLARLERLEHLDIQYCSKLTDVGVVNDLPLLRSLTLVGCGDIGLPAIQRKLSGLERVRTGGSR
ncbi:leucine-rich repeat domain-containing protein [Leucobacter zeae]|nr:leucine-rich repeat domain-containing protein [Leucobacter zeae]